MIDQIQKAIGKIDTQQIKTAKNSEKAGDGFKSAVVSDNGVAKDIADISDIAKSDNVTELAANAPIDLEQVNAIKNAIATGDYPIDYDRIADALMDVYKEMQS